MDYEKQVCTAERPDEVRIGDRVRVVLDAGARLVSWSPDEVGLEAGLAWFDVEPGPFLVRTALGDVRVRGTSFEVDVRGPTLVVRVAAGAVEAAGKRIEAGFALEGGEMNPSAEPPGAWFRMPLLVLEGPGLVAEGEAVRLRLVFENRGNVAQEVAGPGGAGTSIWVSVTDPTGAVRDQPVPPESAVSGLLTPGKPLRLGSRERRVLVFDLPHPPGPAGTYRYRALYRPEGQPPLPSSPLDVEVR